MNNDAKPEVVINSTLIGHEPSAKLYEFVLDEALQVVHCGYLKSFAQDSVQPIPKHSQTLGGLLFELNHVRVNPELDNTRILLDFAEAVAEAGVEIRNRPQNDAMAMCFKPLGELSDTVRFYLASEQQLVFLSPSVKLRCINN